MDKPMRVLHVVTKMHRAGLESRTMDIYRNIDRNLIQFDFMVHRDERGAYDDEIESMGGKIYRMRSITPKNFLQYNKDLDLFFKKHKEYTIVHSHLNTLSTYVLRAAKQNNIPIRIAHSRNSSMDVNYKMIFKYISKLFLPKQATHYFACSEMAGKWLFGQKRVKLDNFKVIPNAIDLEKFRYNSFIRDRVRKELSLENNFVVGNVARLTPQKNHELLLDIFLKVCEGHTNAMLLLVGTGKSFEKISNYAEKLGVLDKIIFLGERSDVNELLQAMDVFVFPSFYEGFGTVVVESQASGLITIASDVLPKDTQVTKLIHYLPLSKPASIWAEKIEQYSLMYDREDTYDQIKKEGFDIKDTYTELFNFYMMCAQKS